MCISFGMMIGWPSGTYPKLLSKNSSIHITLDESAMIAGMLMNGYVISTPISGIQSLNSKYGQIIGAMLSITGWAILYLSTNVLHLCFSRFFIGIGSGIAIGKFKTYINELFIQEIITIINKSLLIFTILGITTSYIICNLVDLKTFAITSAIVSSVTLLTSLFLPNSPTDLCIKEKYEKAEKILKTIHGINYIEEGLNIVKRTIEFKNLNIIDVVKHKHTRNQLLILTFLIILQQFTGSPALIVYSQLIFTDLGYSNPELYSIIYIIIYLFATFIGINYMNQFKRKLILLISLIGTTSFAITHTIFLYYQIYYAFPKLLPFIMLLFYVFFHTIGLTIVPNLFIIDVFDKNCLNVINIFCIMSTYEFAVIVTKIFQVLYGTYGMHAGFFLFSTTGIIGIIIITLFFKETYKL